MDGLVEEQRNYNIRHAHTSHIREDAEGKEIEITDPVRVRPKGMSRREWRELTRKGYRAVRKQELENRRKEAALPESAKIDRRLHAAGLYSSRDLGRVRTVSLDRVFEIVGG